MRIHARLERGRIVPHRAVCEDEQEARKERLHDAPPAGGPAGGSWEPFRSDLATMARAIATGAREAHLEGKSDARTGAAAATHAAKTRSQWGNFIPQF
jgi:hypothetical protein